MDTTEQVPAVRDGRRTRRRHSEQFKARVVAAARAPGVSVAAVALSNGLNANLLRCWMRKFEPAGASSFIPVALPAPTVRPQPEVGSAEAGADQTVRIEIRRVDGQVTIHWPVSSAPALAAWVQQWLGRDR